MKISTEAKIGIFVTLTIALTVWGINFLKGKDVFKSADKYYSVFESIDGLIESGAIYLKGYKIGTVTNIDFDGINHSITVEYSLEEKVKIPKNSSFQIFSSSIVSGIKDVKLILSNEKEYYEPGDTVPGSIDNGLTEMIEPLKEKVTSAIGRIDSLVASMNAILNEKGVNNLQNSLSNLDGISSSLEKSLSDGGNLDKTLNNLEVFSTTLKNNSDELAAILSNFKEISDSISDSELKAAINNASLSLSNASKILNKINEGEGSMGQLINNDSLYLSLENVSKNLDLLLIDLREHPKRYVHFSVFGKKEK